MLTGIIENIENAGPFFAIVWIVTVACTFLRPQKYFNSFLLMFALLELGKFTLPGWLMTAVLLLAFALLYPRIGSKGLRFLPWLGKLRSEWR